MPHRRNPLAIVLVALLLGVVGIAAGCGDDNDSSDTKTETQAQTTETPTTETPTVATPTSEDGEYPQVAIDNFTRSCEAQSGATASRCKCAIDNLQEKLPYADFVRIDGAIRKGGTEAQQGLAEIQGIIAECRNE
jgi:hypothetical protein